jgi:hypothetical protein
MQKGVFDSPVIILVRNYISPLVGVHPQVEEFWNTHSCKWIFPNSEAAGFSHLRKYSLPIPIPVCDQDTIVVKIGEFHARAFGTLAGEIIQLIVAVEMVAESCGISRWFPAFE